MLVALPLGSIQAGAEDASTKSPLSFIVVDLDGDGFEFIPLEESDVYFDVDGDGLAEKTQWVHPDDGFLFLANNNRTNDSFIVGNIFHFFTNHREKLVKFDRNSDGVYDVHDFSPYTKEKKYQDLAVLIAKDITLIGVPDLDRRNMLKCDSVKLDFTKIDLSVGSTLYCGDQHYGIRTVQFEYEDVNAQWKALCKLTQFSGNRNIDSERFLKEKCL